MTYRHILAVSAAGLVATAPVVQAQTLFDAEVTVSDAEGNEIAVDFGAFDTAENIADFFDELEFNDAMALTMDPRFQSVTNAYTDMSPSSVVLNLRGIDIIAEFRDTGDVITLSVPAIGFEREFDGRDAVVDRDASRDELVDFLEANGEGLLTDILQELVATTPTDPVAGNPASLQSRMVAADFAMGSTVGPSNGFSVSIEGGEAAAGDGSAPNLIGLEARFGRYTAGDFEQTVVDLPFSYVIPLADPRYAVILDMPITYVKTEETDSYSGSFSAGFRLPILDEWSITPSVRVGATGSIDLGSAAVLYGGSVTSNYQREIFGLRFALGNSFSVVRSAPLSVNDYDLEYDLTNFVLRNGIELGGDMGFELFADPVTWEVSVVNTQFLGDDVYIDNATDIAVSFGTEASDSGLTWDSVRLGVTYTFTNEDYQGFMVNFGYQF